MKRTSHRLLFWVSIACIALLDAWSATAAAHHIVATNYYNSFSRAHPVLGRVHPGDTIATTTLDAGGQDENDVQRGQPGNPLTGPFFVESAEPGDTLIVHFRKITMNRKWGWSNYRLGLFSLTPDSIEGLYTNHYKADVVRAGRSNLIPWDIDLKRQTVRLREPTSKIIRLEFPARPMLGCVGVAPAGDFSPARAFFSRILAGVSDGPD